MKVIYFTIANIENPFTLKWGTSTNNWQIQIYKNEVTFIPFTQINIYIYMNI